MNRPVDPPSKANLAGSINSSGGLGQPTVPVLKKIGVAGPPLMGSTYPSAHQQAPSTMACLYGQGLSVVGARSPILVDTIPSCGCNDQVKETVTR